MENYDPRETFRQIICPKCMKEVSERCGNNALQTCGGYSKYLEKIVEQMLEALIHIKESLHDDCFADAEMYTNTILDNFENMIECKRDNYGLWIGNLIQGHCGLQK
jgi:hypothetical protein